jgi:putative ABC transport system permease protein
MSSDTDSKAPRPAGRLARWWAGWRFALRIGLRDSRSHRGRSLLVMILIGVPVLIVTAGLTVAGTTGRLGPEEDAISRLGSSQAAVFPWWQEPGRAIVQDAYGFQVSSLGPAAERPGVDPNAPWRSGDIEALLPRSTVAVVAEDDFEYLISYSGPSPVGVRTLTVDSTSIGDFGLAELVEGRWPARPGELVVTERGIQPGVPRTGPMTISVDGVEQAATVVGVVRAPTTVPWTVIRYGPIAGDLTRFLVQRAEPVTQAEVQRLNEYGLVVQSRSVMEAAPPYAEPAGAEGMSPDVPYIGYAGAMLGLDQQVAQLIQIAAISVGILIEVVLLAGPAFALGAVRQRRIWALIAACGADRRQLRRIVLGQSVVLGGAAAVIGAALGLAVSPLITHLLWWWRMINSYGPWRPPIHLIAAVVVAAVIAAMIAALGPARAAVRRDVASTLNERWQPPGRRGVPWLGAGLSLLATVGMITAATVGHGQWWASPVVIIGCVVLAAGSLMIIPALVAGWARVGHRWPLPIRLAARDVGRQQLRSVPAIAAVAAATAVLAAFGVLFASQTALAIKVHTPVTAPGQAVLNDFSGDRPLRGSLDRIRQQFPDWNYLERERMIFPSEDVGMMRFYSTLQPVAAGCTEADLLRSDERCTAWGDPFASPLIQEIPVADQALAPEAASALRAGKILITDPNLIVDGRVRLVMITENWDTNESTVTRRVELPAVHVDPASLVGTLYHTKSMASEPYGWMLPRTADAHDLPRRLDRVLFGPVDRAITPAEETRIRQLIDPDQPLVIERGHVDDQQTKLLPLLGIAGFLVLLAAVVATALAQVDGRAEQATLAAVGAAPALRRGQAASQALLLAATGMIFGAVVGLIPGTAIALLDQPAAAVAPGPQLAVPWPALGLLIIAVSLIAAGLAACTTRTPVLSRRPT